MVVKAIKEYSPIRKDLADQLKWVEDEIEILKLFANKPDNKYVINYIDSFITELGRDYKVYHIVTSYHNAVMDHKSAILVMNFINGAYTKLLKF